MTRWITRAESPKPRGEDGVALIIVLLVMVALSALAMSLSLLASTESRVTAAYRDGLEVLYGAEAALERVLPDLAAENDLNRVLTGAATSSFTDGPPGLRRLPDATFTDLHALTAMENCGQLYGYGRLPGGSRVYAVVWVADDPSETDQDPFTDGGEGDGVENPGRGRLSLTAHAFGPAGTRRVIEASVAVNENGLHVISWREVR